MSARSLQPPLTVLAGVVLATAAMVFAQGLFATVAFGALAAVICRRLQLALVRHGVRNGLAITLTVTAVVVVLAALAVAGFAAVAAIGDLGRGHHAPVWTLVIGPMGALLAVPLTITLRAILLPFPGARWFVSLLGPVPEDHVPAPSPGPPGPSS